jgi:hypothetical protein
LLKLAQALALKALGELIPDSLECRVGILAGVIQANHMPAKL